MYQQDKDMVVNLVDNIPHMPAMVLWLVTLVYINIMPQVFLVNMVLGERMVTMVVRVIPEHTVNWHQLVMVPWLVVPKIMV